MKSDSDWRRLLCLFWIAGLLAVLLPLGTVPDPVDAAAQTGTIRFAVIGDYGDAGPNEEAVANMVKGWNPDFIITTGDNNYFSGSASTIDRNIGQYYHSFIHPYTGSYGPGASTNRFFPSLGNHDWGRNGVRPYTDYFALPDNERYYDFVWGPVHFFALDSDNHEPDGVTATSSQGNWLKAGLASSTARWKIVYFHHPPYSSGSHGNSPWMQWPFKEWGASVVLTGHDHDYERLFVNGLPYFVNGLGGQSHRNFSTPVPGSQIRFTGNYGAMLVEATAARITFQFYSIANGGTLVDSYILQTSSALAAPTQIAPAHGTLTRVRTPTFSWTRVTNATIYHLQVDDHSDFSSPVINVRPRTTDYTSTTPLGTATYYWRVRAGSGGGVWSGWSSVWRLNIDVTRPGTPTLLAPPDKATVTDSTPLLDWSDASDAHSYHLQIDNNPDFSSLVLNFHSSNATSNFTPGSALADGVYYWRVRTFDAAGNKSGFTPAFKLRINAIPTPTPSLVSPANGSRTTDATPTFTWTAGSGVKKYKIQVDNNADFTSPVINVNTVAQSYTPPVPLEKNVVYYWRVQAQGTDNVWGAWSSVRTVHIVKTLAPEDAASAMALPFYETFDSGERWAASGRWQTNSEAAHSGAGWFVEAETRGQSSTLTAEYLLDLTTAQAPQISFWQKMTLSSGDTAALDISFDGGLTWQPLNVQVGVTEDWALHTVDLSAYRGGVIRLRFRLDTFGVVPGGQSSIGWWIDDLAVLDVPPVRTTP